MNRSVLSAVSVVLALFLAGCGDGDAGEQQAEADAEAYCALAASLDEQDGPPTNEQLEALHAAAPEAIAEDVRAVADAFAEEGVNAFSSQEVNAHISVIEAYEEEHCPQGEGEDDGEPQAQEPDPDAAVVQVVATDFALEVQGPVPAGKVAFVMANEGQEPHHIGVVRLKDGTTVEQAEQAAEDGKTEELIVDEAGTSSTAGPGSEAVLNADLVPGVYGMACFVEGEDGVPHFFKGMRTFFEVA